MSRAASRGHVDAQVCLGVLLVRGEGVRCDPAAAARWFARAAEHGDGPAQRRLARCYASGFGVPLDPAEAYKWLTLASYAGDERARELREALAGELSARQRWEAQRRAREWTLSRAGRESEAIA
jgi:TPR repeat protein